jgi:hypothetical protein
MSVRIWLQKGGHVDIEDLLKSGNLVNLKVHTHHVSGKKYVKLGVGLMDPTEEIPQIPKRIVERVTFKGRVFLLADYSQNSLPLGSFHSADMATHMLINANTTEDDKVYESSRAKWNEKPEKKIAGRTWWCEVSVSGPSVAAVREMLSRLISSTRFNDEFLFISLDHRRSEDEKNGKGCFKALTGFPAA